MQTLTRTMRRLPWSITILTDRPVDWSWPDSVRLLMLGWTSKRDERRDGISGEDLCFLATHYREHEILVRRDAHGNFTRKIRANRSNFSQFKSFRYLSVAFLLSFRPIYFIIILLRLCDMQKIMPVTKNWTLNFRILLIYWSIGTLDSLFEKQFEPLTS